MLQELRLSEIGHHRSDLIKTRLQQMADEVLCLGVLQHDSFMFRCPITQLYDYIMFNQQTVFSLRAETMAYCWQEDWWRAVAQSTASGVTAWV